MHYPKETAGRLLTELVPVVTKGVSVNGIVQLIHSKADSFETINYIYIVDKEHKLVGVLSIKELFNLNQNDDLGEFLNRKLITVRPHTDQEKVAQIALRHTIKAVPVVSKDGVFMGVVPSDVILEILNQEHTEDIFKLAGVNHEINNIDTDDLLLEGSSFLHTKSRLPWLLLGLAGGVGAAVVVEWFEGTLENQIILAAFIPAIVYMADAVGSQTQMLFVRALSLKGDLNILYYIKREFIVNFILGVILSLLIFTLSYLWIGSIAISSILGLSIFLTVCSTVLVAIFIPWIINKRGLDPAVASGPLATVVRDIMSLLIYLLVASFILSL